MPAGQYNLYIEQGATFYKKLIFKDAGQNPIVLTGYTFRGQIRDTSSSATVILSFTFNILDQTANPGQLEMTLTALETASITVPNPNNDYRAYRELAYDVERVTTSSGEVDRILEGLVTVSAEVTR